jgi:hypothetical protein
MSLPCRRYWGWYATGAVEYVTKLIIASTMGANSMRAADLPSIVVGAKTCEVCGERWRLTLTAALDL